MHLNSLKPAPGAKKDKMRVGRGIGCGKGKTCGRGHKGQHSRSGGYHKVGFEGGQMRLMQRVPKLGFRSRKSLVSAEIRLHELNNIEGDVVNLVSLHQADLITSTVKQVKIFASGKLDKKVTVSGIRVTKGAREAIEAAGGKVED